MNDRLKTVFGSLIVLLIILIGIELILLYEFSQAVLIANFVMTLIALAHALYYRHHISHSAQGEPHFEFLKNIFLQSLQAIHSGYLELNAMVDRPSHQKVAFALNTLHKDLIQVIKMLLSILRTPLFISGEAEQKQNYLKERAYAIQTNITTILTLACDAQKEQIALEGPPQQMPQTAIEPDALSRQEDGTEVISVLHTLRKDVSTMLKEMFKVVDSVSVTGVEVGKQKILIQEHNEELKQFMERESPIAGKPFAVQPQIEHLTQQKSEVSTEERANIIEKILPAADTICTSAQMLRENQNDLKGRYNHIKRSLKGMLTVADQSSETIKLPNTVFSRSFIEKSPGN